MNIPTAATFAAGTLIRLVGKGGIQRDWLHCGTYQFEQDAIEVILVEEQKFKERLE